MLVEKLYPSTLIETNLYGLSLIESACQMLRNGPASINDLWPGQLDKPPSPPLNLYVDMEAKEELLNLRKAHRALKKLQSSLDAKIGFMERAHTPAILHAGIHSLPNEILERILYEARDRGLEAWKAKKESLGQLGSVNARFRDLCRRLSKMIEMRNYDHRISTWSVRSICRKSQELLQKVTMLEVTIAIRTVDCLGRGDMAKLPAAIASCVRLQHFEVKIRICFRGASAFTDARRLQLQTRSTLPNVESFTFRVSVFEENEEVSKALTSLFLSLRMPKLVDLEFTIYNLHNGLRRTPFRLLPWEKIFPVDRPQPRLRNLSLQSFPFYEEEGEYAGGRTCSFLLPGLLERLPNTQSLTTCLEKVSHDCPELAALARLRELTLNGCLMNMDEFEAFLRALFEQEEVNLERITIYPGATYNREWSKETMKTFRLPVLSASSWTDKLRGTLKNDFVVEFT